MSKLSVQFHATNQEIARFVDEVVRDFELDTVIARENPFGLICAQEMQFRDEIENGFMAYDKVCCSLSEIQCEADSWSGMNASNPDALFIECGGLSSNGLKESFLFAISEDPEAMKAWRAVAKRLKGKTKAGVWVINPKTNAKGYYKNFRYSSGAFELSRKGIKMLPAAGWNLVEFEEGAR